jgi:excisionase family DNA binding protein
VGRDADRSLRVLGVHASSSHPAEPPLTLPEAAAYLNVSQRFMRRLIAERRIAFYKLGRFVRFRVADLDRFLSSGRIEAADPPTFFGRQRR